MKWTFVWLLPALALAAWSNADLEIFKLRDNVVADLGEDTTFYSWLGVKASASAADIQKAYRKISIGLHPDRNPAAGATERFARLNAVYKLLRSENRAKYDFYLAKGFPVLTEGDYLFRRYRPGVIAAVILLAILYSIAEFLVLQVSYKRKRDFIQNIIDEALEEARGKAGVVTTTKRIQLSNGKRFVVHPTGEVLLLDEKTGREEPVTVDAIAEPTYEDTSALKLVKFVKRKVNHLLGNPETPAFAVEAKLDDVPGSDTEFEGRNVRAAKRAAVQEIKKGAARRRPAGNHGKSR